MNSDYRLKSPLPIYPSLLDSWQWMAEAESSEDWELRRSQFIDALNRVRTEPTEIMSRGTALNNAVDDLLQKRWKCSSEERSADALATTISALADGKQFVFDRKLVESIVDRLGDAVPQVYSACSIATMYGDVTLYGYADYVNYDKVTDLKCSGTYSIGKYAGKWQRRVYPLTLVGGGMLDTVKEFEYLCAEVKERKGVIYGTLCPETYLIDLKSCEDEVRYLLESAIIPFIVDHKDDITNDKITAAI